MATPSMRLFAALAAQRSSRSVARQTRHFSAPTVARRGKDDILDKDAVNPTSTEYSKSGGGDSGAAHDSDAFDPSKTSPESQSQGKEASNPLNMSPANKEAAAWDPAGEKPKEGNLAETGANAGSQKSSGGGSPPKSNKI